MGVGLDDVVSWMLESTEGQGIVSFSLVNFIGSSQTTFNFKE